MPFRHPVDVREQAVSSVLAGVPARVVAAQIGASLSSVYAWVHAAHPERRRERASCLRCRPAPEAPVDVTAYVQLLGHYLGDGCISQVRGTFSLRITCDDRYPGVSSEVEDVLRRVSGRSVHRVAKAGCHDVQAVFKHWPCLFPQHGPGRKHARRIVLEDWQEELVKAHPGRLLRGLFLSDGWRGTNVAVHRSGGTAVRYHYARYEFSNRSSDVLELCTSALDDLGIAWRPAGSWRLSVARRGAVALLDEHVGPKC